MSDETTRLLLAAERVEDRIQSWRRRQGRLVNLAEHEKITAAAVDDFNARTGKSLASVDDIKTAARVKRDEAKAVLAAREAQVTTLTAERDAAHVELAQLRPAPKGAGEA